MSTGENSIGWAIPILASPSIVQCSIQLHAQQSEPMGMYQWLPTKTCACTNIFLHADEVIKIMRDHVAVAHPDLNHYLCQAICTAFDCHSMQVTTCVVLGKGNPMVDQIAHKLQWNVKSIKHYMFTVLAQPALLWQKCYKVF